LNRPVHGILGQNFLSRFDYGLDFTTGRMHLGRPPEFLNSTVIRIPFRYIEGRIAIPVHFPDSGVTREFLLDSGASTLVIPQDDAPRIRPESVGKALLSSSNGIRETHLVRIRRLEVGGRTFRNLQAAQHQSPGLFPAGLFGIVYINLQERYIEIMNSGTVY
jgi:hypothetical protein